MSIALVGAFATIAALIAAAVWIVSVVRADGRERAAALQLAEKLQGDVNIERERSVAERAVLVRDVRAATRRADALEEWARGRFATAVDDGTDLLLAELSIAAAGSYDTDGTVTVSLRSDQGTSSRVPDRAAEPGTPDASAGDASRDGELPGGGAP
jgi:hypothetical protein